MDQKIKLITDSMGVDKFKMNQPLSEFTALKVSGPALAFFVAFTQSEIIRIVGFCRDLKVPFLLFGTGSKMMISDNGFNGVVIKNRTRNMKVLSVKGKVSKLGIGVDEALLEIESGVSMNIFADFLNKQRLNFEEFVNIPGSIGGNLFLNMSLREKTQDIKVLEQDLTTAMIKPRDLSLSKHIILSATFKIKAR